MQNNKNTLWAIILAVILIVIAYIAWATATSPKNDLTSTDQSGVICTADAMQCPNGSWVGRTGPNCQFVCNGTGTPATPATTTPKTGMTLGAKLGQRLVGYGENLTVVALVEDSRCPSNVQCIQAGTVRIGLRIENPSTGTTTPIIKLGDTLTTETESIMFYSVGPNKTAGATIKQGDYTFALKVTKK